MSLNQTQTEFIKKIKEANKYGITPYEAYSDFCTYGYNCLNKFRQISKQEKKDIRYKKLESIYEELLCLTEKGLETVSCDFLGEIAGELSMLNKKGLGQCFTPFSVSKMCVLLNIDRIISTLNKKDYITVSEPCAGSGGMLIALANVLKEKNISLTKILVCGVELDRTTYYSLCIQLNMIGMQSVCINANTLSLEGYDYTCTQGLMYLYKGWNIFFKQCIKDFKLNT